MRLLLLLGLGLDELGEPLYEFSLLGDLRLLLADELLHRYEFGREFKGARIFPFFFVFIGWNRRKSAALRNGAEGKMGRRRRSRGCGNWKRGIFVNVEQEAGKLVEAGEAGFEGWDVLADVCWVRFHVDPDGPIRFL